MTEMNGASETIVLVGPKKSAKKRSASAASSRPASGRKKTHGKAGAKGKAKAKAKGRARSKKGTPKHWSATHAQLVLHATPDLVKRLDRKLAKLGKSLKCNPTRGAVIRALVERATK